MTEPDALRNIVEQIRAGQRPTGTPRQLLSWFEAKRRRPGIVERIRSRLTELEIKTDPDFEDMWVDGTITFRPVEEPVSYSGRGDPTHRVRRLRAANNPPTYVSPNTTLHEALMIMIENDFSQLPVMTSEREVKGVLTYAGIAVRLAQGVNGSEARQFMDEYHEIPQNMSIMQAVKHVIEHECVLVRGNDNKIAGIITATDLSHEFHVLGEPFLILGEIENHIRNMLHGKLTQADLEEAKDPSDSERQIEDLADLTFGEYIRLLEDLRKWQKSGIHAEQKCFVEELVRVRDIRNDVMHFAPDGIEDDELHILRRFVRYLRRVREAALS